MKIFAEQLNQEEILYTPVAILDLLSQIDELKNFELGLTESLDGVLQLQVGDSYYALNADLDTEISVSEQDIDKIEKLTEDAYDQLIDNDIATYQEDVNGGIIKEALKTLAIGGIVRLSKKYLQS